MTALAPYQVVELADERNQLAGYLLGTLGAEVIAVEPPGGSSARRRGPFLHDRPGPETSLLHWSYDRGKQSVVLDVEAAGDRERLLGLARGADLFVESTGQRRLAALGLGYEDLAAVNPGLVYVSVSAFGSDASTALDGDGGDNDASDLEVLAASGALLLGGDPDRAPCRLSLPQAWVFAATAAAGAALVALYERNRFGRGQHVDVSAQQVCTIAAGGWVLSAPANAPATTRAGGGTRSGRLNVRYVWPARDGHVSITHLFGPAFGPATRRLMDWVHEAGFCDEAMRDRDWIDYGRQLMTGEESEEAYERVRDTIVAFTSSSTKAELFAEARRRRVLLAPVNTVPEVYDTPQFAARGYWQELTRPGVDGPVRYPGPWARPSATPLVAPGPAPSVGRHTDEVLARPPRRPAPVSPDETPPALPLSGVKVLDFTWAFAGPTLTRALADHGATVVRVESSRALDAARTVMPYRNNEPGIERSVIYSSLNAGKLGLALDLSQPEGRAVARDLAGWADVVVESFSPKAMPAWGLDYDSLRELNPGLVMLSTCLMGQTGPLSDFAGFGNLAGAMCGFTNLLGWADRAPAGPFAAYTDYVAPHFMLVALLAALDHRRRTRQGQHIDFSQAEASLHFLTPALLDYAVNGRTAERAGNDDSQLAPHGVYRVAGDDEWVVIVCADDARWEALCDEMGRPDLAADPGLATVAGRVEHRQRINEAIEAWTSPLKAATALGRLRTRGVAARAVSDSHACFEDPDLVRRRHFVEVDHPVMGTHVIEGVRYHLSRTTGGPKRGGPTLNEHLFDVLGGLLGYSENRIAELIVNGVLE